MAEIAVNEATNRLLSLLADEARLLRDVHAEVEDIKRELLFIQAFLKDADAKAQKGDTSQGVKTWVQELRETAYCIEDLVDEYILHFANLPRGRGVIGFLCEVSHLIPKLKPRREIASKLQDLKLKLGNLKTAGSSYGFISSFEQGSEGSSGTSVPWHDPGVTSLFIEEAEIVGIESPKDELINWLVEGAPERTVISVVGMGGLGKTTLAKKVYDNKRVVEHFDCYAWITVSQSFKMEEVLRNMIKKFYDARKESIPEATDTMDEMSLITRLREYLEDKRYAVVFYDVWKLEFWRFIKYVLPENRRGSRIVITTRNVEIGSAVQESSFHHVHNLQALPPESSWELFCKKAFQGCCPPELEKTSLDIVKRCAGLPLAIVAMGGALSTKEKNELEWQKFNDSLGSQLESNPHLESITKILSLSYDDLPDYLKSCFLYFAFFPEDDCINSARLIRLWIAEGFVKGKKRITLEQVAEEYLTELIHRSLVQWSHVDYKGKIRGCRVHDLMREIILKKAEELSFCHVLGEEDSSFDGKFRRGSVQKSADNVVETINRNSQIRSILFFDIDAMSMLFIATSLTNFKHLKVLDFEDAPLYSVPEDLGNLFHLRYLSLRKTKVQMLPKSIGKLQNLQTLDLKHSLVEALPVEIKKLQKLRHILAYTYKSHRGWLFPYVRGIHVGEGIGCMVDLQKLCYVEANHRTDLIEELGKLKQLRKLGITNLMEEDGLSLCASISNMKVLEALCICSRDDDILNLETISDPPRYLRTLYLEGSLSRLPDWLPTSRSLVSVSLRRSRLSYDPMEVLQALPNLLEVELISAYEGECLYVAEFGFQKLKRLQLFGMMGLKTLEIHDGALPLLEHLEIGPNPRMEEVPSGIRLLKSLARIDFWDMPRELAYSMLPEGGQNYHIVEHVPNVFFHCPHAGGYKTGRLR